MKLTKVDGNTIYYTIVERDGTYRASNFYVGRDLLEMESSPELAVDLLVGYLIKDGRVYGDLIDTEKALAYYVCRGVKPGETFYTVGLMFNSQADLDAFLAMTEKEPDKCKDYMVKWFTRKSLLNPDSLSACNIEKVTDSEKYRDLDTTADEGIIMQWAYDTILGNELSPEFEELNDVIDAILNEEFIKAIHNPIVLRQ